MLLDVIRFGVSISTSILRNQREETITTNRRAEKGKAKDPKTASPLGTKAKGAYGGSIGSGRYRSNDKDRKPDRRSEGSDSTIRRSASELGIEWAGSYCPDGKPHYFIEKYGIGIGALFRCKWCLKHKWLPVTYYDAKNFDDLVGRHGVESAYMRVLDKNRDAKILVAKLQDLWYARKRITDNRELINLTISVMGDNDYDRREAS